MKIIFVLISSCSIFCLALGQAQVTSRSTSLSDELMSFYNITALPSYRANTTEAQESSYDRTGGNDDGFSGKYSFLRRNPDSSLVIFDVQGAGVLNRIWTPTPINDTLDFYIDDTLRPALSICYMDLFSGKVYPFVAPLCDHHAGGYYCYFPILFQHRCKIVDRGKKLQFHQEGYRLYPPGTVVKPFSSHLSELEKSALNKIAELWNKSEKSEKDFSAGKSQDSASAITLNPGQSRVLCSLQKGGRITGIELEPSSVFSGEDKQIWIRIAWDDQSGFAVNCPVADFFGYAFGHPAMQSLLVGEDSAKAYCYFPMPFDKKATITLFYNGSGKPFQCVAKIYYNNKERDAVSEGKFYAAWKKDSLTENDPYHVFLNIHGKGHYVGSILQAQGTRDKGTGFFEGDDSTATDGVFRMHGTGSEDYFNGGWYAIKGRWDSTRSMPLSGCLDYNGDLSRTGGYRLYLSDKIPFENSIYQCIEHGPTIKGIPAIYTSVAFYYCDRPPE